MSENCEHKSTRPGATNPDRFFCNDCDAEVAKKETTAEYMDRAFEEFWEKFGCLSTPKMACKCAFLAGASAMIDRMIIKNAQK